MKKRLYYRKILALVLVLCMIVPFNTYAAEETEQTNSTELMLEEANERSEEVSVGEKFEDFFAHLTEDEIQQYSNCRELFLKTINDYKIQSQDLEMLNKHFPLLQKMDVNNCEFDSEQSFQLFKEYYEAVDSFEFICDESRFPQESPEQDAYQDSVGDAEGNEANSAPEVSTENKPTESQSSDEQKPDDEISTSAETPSSETTLKGMCILDKGTWLHVGVDYESADSDIQFQWLQYDVSGQSWSYISWPSKSNWTEWKPQKTGNYWLCVQAISKGEVVTSYTYAYTWKGIQTNLTGIYMLKNGNEHKMGVCYSSNDPNLQFRWQLYDLQRKVWSLQQEKSESNWTTWTPTVAGHYWMYVEAIDSNGGVTSYTMPIYFEGLSTQLSGIGVIEHQKYIDMGVSYTSNDTGLEFRWLLYNVGKKQWTQISDWSKGNWASWKPEITGEYWLWVDAKNSDGKVKSQSYVYSVRSARITSLSASPDTPSWAGTEIQIQGKYWDINDEVASDRMLLWDGQNWKELPCEQGKTVWTPTEVKGYLICYEILDKEGKVIEQSFKAYNIEIPYVNLNGIYVRNDGNKNYAMAVNYDTNDKQIQFRWLYYDLSSSQWHVMKDWNTGNGTTWKAPHSGYFWLRVEARLHDGTSTYKMITYSVREYQNPAGYYQIRDNISLSGGDYNLTYGYEGLKVMYVMRALGVGYGIGMGGAYYGSNVASAVSNFQRNAGLPANGIVDYATWTRMGLSASDWFNLGAYVSPMRVGPQSTRTDHIEAMISRAYDYLGTSYVIGASGPPGTGVDCSGIVMQALYAAGLDTSPINPVRHSYPGYEYESANMWSSPMFKHVSFYERQRGDLIFYQSASGAVIHVAIYLGNDTVIESWPNQVGKRKIIRRIVLPQNPVHNYC